MFKILQWNCRDFLGKFAEVSNLIRDFQVICLQEAWLNHTNKVSFKDHFVFRCGRPPPRCGGGVLILCRKDLDPILYKTDRIKVSGCDLIVISILNKKLDAERILVASINLQMLISTINNGVTSLMDCYKLALLLILSF